MTDPKETTAYKVGWVDYFSGFAKNDNPYEADSTNYNLWVTGYKAGEKQDVDHDPDGN